jgi:hypothetical protein
MNESDFAFYLMLGQTAQREISRTANIVPRKKIMLSDAMDLSELLPAEVKDALETAEVFTLFYVFENYIRDLVLDSLSETYKENWYSRVPSNIQVEIDKTQENDERKAWMAHSSRSQLDFATLPQLISIIDDKDNWKDVFEPILRDRSLINETRAICHTRNLVCHMHVVSSEEMERLKQVVRDWFRIIAP